MRAKVIEEVLAGPADWVNEDGHASFWMAEPFAGGMSWIGRWNGSSPWTRHPDGEALLYNYRGACVVIALTDEGEVESELPEGAFCVLPQGVWHRYRSTEEVVQWGTSPGDTQHSDADDPRDVA